MQGSLSLPKRVSLQSLCNLQSYRTFGIRSGGCCSFPLWLALELEQPGSSNSSVRSIRQRTSPGVTNDLPRQGSVTAKGLIAFSGGQGNTNMRGGSFATLPSCSYKTEVARSRLNWAIPVVEKSCGSVLKSSCGIPKEAQRNTACQWLSLQSQRGYARKPVVVVAGKKGGRELLVAEDFEFKRVLSESNSTTTFYSSDISSSSEDDEVEEDNDWTAGKEKKAKAPKANAEGSESESDEEEEIAKKRKSLKKTDNSKSEMKALGKYDDMAIAKGQVAGKCEDSDGESEDEQEKKLMKKVDIVGKYEDSDSESEDEEEEKVTKEEKKIAKAELKLKEKLDKDILKTMKREEKKQKKEAKKLEASKKFAEENDSDENGNKKLKLDCKGKNEEESDSDSESDEEGEHNVKAKSKLETKLKIEEDLARDSDNEQEDDGVTDFGDDTLEEDEQNFVTAEDEMAAIGLENELVDEMEGELDDLDEEDDFWDDEEGDVVVGDGGTGGGVVLGGTEWGKKALVLAEQVVAECGKDLSIFAFKVSSDRVIRVRLDKLSDRYGSPTMTDIESFNKRFSIALEEAGEGGALPKDIDVEVSSPGAERVVRVPDDLERFKELPMYVQYVEGETELEEKDGVLELDCLDMEAGLSVWKIANVKLNREVEGRGRPLNSKQKKWRASVPFASLKQVRLYLDV